MTADKAVGEVAHCKTEKVSGNGLHDILHEFRTVAFNSFPFLGRFHTFIIDTFTAEFILTNLRLYIAEKSARWKLDEKHSAFIEEVDATDFCRNTLFDGCLYGTINIPPESRYHMV